MSPEREQQIRSLVDNAQPGDWTDWRYMAARDLLAELDRLRARLAEVGRERDTLVTSRAADVAALSSLYHEAARAALRSDAGARDAAWKKTAMHVLSEMIEPWECADDPEKIEALVKALLSDRIAAAGSVEPEVKHG